MSDHVTTFFDSLADVFPGDNEIRDAVELHRAAWTHMPPDEFRLFVVSHGALLTACGTLQVLGYPEPADLLLKQYRQRLLTGSRP